MASQDPFEVKFTSREVSAWGDLALLKRMLDGLGFKAAMQSWDLPQPGSNRRCIFQPLCIEPDYV